MDGFRRGASWIAILACTFPGSASAQVVLDGGGVTLRAPAALDCAALPVIAVEGAIAAALAGDRTALTDVVSRMSLGIASACPAAEALRFEGTDRGVTVSFRTEKAQGWRMPGAAAPPAPATAAPAVTEVPEAPQAAAASRPASPAAPATAAAAPASPSIAPGVDFATLAAFYGGVTTIRGHATLQPTETWTRILAARAYAERPDILADDTVALEVAQLMLSPVEFQQFAGPISQQLARGVQNLSVFDRRDLAERVRTQLKPYLDQRRQTGPIDVVHVTPVRLGEYSFEKGAFPFQGAPQRNHPSPAWRGYRLMQLLDAVAFPEELRTSVDEARQIDEFLRARRDPTIYLGVFVGVDPRAPDGLVQENSRAAPQGSPVVVRQVALYFDEALTQMLFDFTPVLAERQVAIAALQAEFGRPRLTAEGLINAIAAVTSDTAAPGRVVDAAVRTAEAYQLDPVAARSETEAALARAVSAQRQRIAAGLSIQPYSAGLGGLPVTGWRFEQPTFANQYMNAGFQISLFPDLALLPVTPEQGARITEAVNARGIETVLEVDVVQGSVLFQNDYLQTAATLTPRRVLIFTGRGGQPIAERELLADITLPEAPTLPDAPFATFGGAAKP